MWAAAERSATPRHGRIVATLLTVAAVSACFSTPPLTSPARESDGTGRTSDRPHIILILADDLDREALEHLPGLRAMLSEQGATFSNAFVSTPQCCPSRATILRGQYAHNTGVLGNKPPDGGAQAFHGKGLEASTVATWLRDAGYRTALLGKYLNGYLDSDLASVVPPGWDEWYAVEDSGYFDYTVSDNGTLARRGSRPEDYSTDVLARKAGDVIRRSARDPDRPLFLYVAPIAPHVPATPAPRHSSAFAGLEVPRRGSYDEADVSDKPQWVQRKERLNAHQRASLDRAYGDRLRTMLAVEDLVRSIIETLRETGQLDRAYVFFSSDNGYHLRQHRLTPGKLTPYEEDIRVPLMVRGPGIRAGAVREHLVLNTDLAPTWAELAGVTPPSFVDGRSFAPLLRDPAPASWRAAVLVEATPAERTAVDTEERATPRKPAFTAIRTAGHTYVEYATGERELYDVVADPYQLENLAASADPDLVRGLAERLRALRTCSGPACRSAEDR